MDLQEGDILEGAINVSGSVGSGVRWIVVAPDGKTHLHSAERGPLHCWPIHAAIRGLETGALKRIGRDPAHPMLRLQRAKEARGIHDVHLGFTEASLAQMLGLLEAAVASGEDYAPYAGAEIDAFVERGMFSGERRREIASRVAALLADK